MNIGSTPEGRVSSQLHLLAAKCRFTLTGDQARIRQRAQFPCSYVDGAVIGADDPVTLATPANLILTSTANGRRCQLTAGTAPLLVKLC